MKRTYYCLIAVIVACAIMLAVLALTSSSLSLDPEPITKVIDFGYMQIRVETEKNIYHLGETVQIRVFQKNLCDSPIQGGFGCIGFGVLNSKGQSVNGLLIFTTWSPDFNIPPFGEVEIHVPSWGLTYDKGGQVPPGTYTIQLELDSNNVEFQVAVIR